jgi:hypothetical protein
MLLAADLPDHIADGREEDPPGQDKERADNFLRLLGEHRRPKEGGDDRPGNVGEQAADDETEEKWHGVISSGCGWR